MSSTVSVNVYIRKRMTGEERLYRDAVEADGGIPNTFIWSDGNFACDCNRRLLFARAAGEPDDWSGGCSEGDYVVRIVWDGQCIYAETDEESTGG